MASTTKTGNCIVCGEKTDDRCEDCSDRLNSNGKPSPTYYCSDECRAGHRSQHRGHCKDNVNIRTQLERGSGLLQELFVAFRLSGFDLKFQSVEKKGDKLIVHEASDEMGGEKILFPFPEDMVANEADRAALISLYSCGDPPAYLCGVTKGLFKGILGRSLKLTEQQLRVNKKFWRVVYYRGGELATANFRHEIIVATLSDGSQYAIDLAGAQYGQLKALVPYNEYQHDYVVETFPEKVFGTLAAYMEGAAAGLEEMPPDADMRVVLMQRELMSVLNSAVEIWEKANKQTIAQLLKEKLPVYASKKKELVTQVRGDMQEYLRWGEARGGFFGKVAETGTERTAQQGLETTTETIAKGETTKKAKKKSKAKKQNSEVPQDPRAAALAQAMSELGVDDTPVQRHQLSASDIDKKFANTNMPEDMKDFVREFAAGGGNVVSFF